MPPREHMYDPSATYAARRALTIGGQQFPVGALVPRTLAGDERTYRKWFEARMLTRAVPNSDAPAQSAPSAQPVPKGMVPVSNGVAHLSVNTSGLVPAIDQAAGIVQNAVADMVASAQTVPASEKLMDAVAAQAVTQPPAQPDPNMNPQEGYIEPCGRGWCTVIFRDKQEKVRGLALASKRLDQFREEAGLAPLSPPEESAAEPLKAGDQIVDGETGEITTVGEAGELPDEEAPSAPWEGAGG